MPSGKAGKTFIRELASLYIVASTLECFALKACTVLQCLLLQKPHIESKYMRLFWNDGYECGEMGI